jgi:biopolymer transport protein ExbD
LQINAPINRLHGDAMRLDAVARQKRKLNMTPLIDAVFILLLFFMVATSFDQHQGVEINLSTENRSTSSVTPSLVLLSLDAEGGLSINGTPVSSDNVIRALQDAAPDKQAVIIIKPHADTPSGTVIQVLDQARRSELGAVSLAR